MRQAPHVIRDKRERKEVSFLITGATGFLGSHLTIELLKRGYAVTILCRPRGTMSPQERISRLLRWFGLSPAQFTRLSVKEAFIDQENLGMEPNAYSSLIEKTDEILHCAASTSFVERKREEIEKVNLQSLENILDLATQGGCYFFHHLSTAFSAGKRTTLCEETFSESTEFNNVYEETKHKAEKLALRICRTNNLRLNIYRPSIVYGHSQTGKSIRFNALYYPVKLAYAFKELYARDIDKNGGEAASKMGVYRDLNHQIHLPLRIETCSKGGLNLIPIDYFVEACLAILEESLRGDVFHIVNSRNKRLKELIQYTQNYFGISGIQAVSDLDYDHLPQNPLEKLWESYMQIYQPYTQDIRIFDNKKANAILEGRKIFCPTFNYEIFQRIMRYAVHVAWGKKLFAC
jgi:nucleoside-diphosphate-sugar epimerase